MININDLWRKLTQHGQRTRLAVRTYSTQRATLFTICHAEYQWRVVRGTYLKYNCACAACAITKELEVHHVKPWHLYPDLRFEYGNLITLCRACHFRFGHGLNWKAWNPKIRELCQSIIPLRSEIIKDGSQV